MLLPVTFYIDVLVDVLMVLFVLMLSLAGQLVIMEVVVLEGITVSLQTNASPFLLLPYVYAMKGSEK